MIFAPICQTGYPWCPGRPGCPGSHPKISVVLRISGRAFEFPVERSKFKKSGSSKKFGHTPKNDIKTI